jgi:hypothetical protein
VASPKEREREREEILIAFSRIFSAVIFQLSACCATMMMMTLMKACYVVCYDHKMCFSPSVDICNYIRVIHHFHLFLSLSLARSVSAPGFKSAERVFALLLLLVSLINCPRVKDWM